MERILKNAVLKHWHVMEISPHVAQGGKMIAPSWCVMRVLATAIIAIASGGGSMYAHYVPEPVRASQLVQHAGLPVIKQELNINQVMWLALGIVLASFPHWQRLPTWIPILHMGLLVARIYIPYNLPAFWSLQKNIINIIRLLVMSGGVIGVYGSYGSLAGRDVGVALLVLLAGLKIFESKSERDYYISTYLGYFLIITNFFTIKLFPQQPI